MKVIFLTQGKFALIDDEDYLWLNQWKWRTVKKSRSWYAVRHRWIKPKYHVVYMHRLILGLQEGDGRQVDHINRNGLDNQRCNLRFCNHQQNHYNFEGYSDTTSKYKGVHRRKDVDRWIAMIANPETKKTQNLGHFRDEIDAAIAYDLMADKYHGDFATLNFPRVAS